MLKVSLIAHTPDPERVVAAAAKLCYSNAEIDTLMQASPRKKAGTLCGCWPAWATKAPPST